MFGCILFITIIWFVVMMSIFALADKIATPLVKIKEDRFFYCRYRVIKSKKDLAWFEKYSICVAFNIRYAEIDDYQVFGAQRQITSKKGKLLNWFYKTFIIPILAFLCFIYLVISFLRSLF